MNFNDHQRRRTHGSTRGRGSSSGYATRDNRTWSPNSRASSTGNRQTSNERPTQFTHATGRGDSGNRRHASPGRSHVGQGGNTHGDSDCRDAPNTEPLTRCDDTQAGHSRDATAMAAASEPLNRCLETFFTRLSKTNERSEKSRRVFKKPRCYKNLDLLLRSNLVQQELSRMNINSLSLLDKTVQVTPQVMRMLGGLLEREVTRDDPEWTSAVASLTIREKLKIMPSRRQHEENERDCRTIVQQLVSSIPPRDFNQYFLRTERTGEQHAKENRYLCGPG